MRVDRLPAATLQLFNGGGPPAQGEQLEHVQVYKNGGVGCLGQMGTQEAAVRAERWAWLTITRKEGELRTYVNGRLCAEVKLVSAKEEAQKKKEEEAKRKKADGGGRDPDGDGADGDGGGGGGRGKEPVKLPQEKFCVDPKQLALFATAEADADADADALDAEGAERGICVQFVKLESKCWGAEAVRDELSTQRGRDEEAELDADADEARALQLTLQPLYAKPPPIWLHPAFAAEFGDAFIAGTGACCRCHRHHHLHHLHHLHHHHHLHLHPRARARQHAHLIGGLRVGAAADAGTRREGERDPRAPRALGTQHGVLAA
jgi:hypothetical protein